MANAFDPYREALVIEQKTLWSAEAQSLEMGETQRGDIAAWLHAHPAEAAELEYLRLTAGFCRQITVTTDDVARYRDAPPPASPPESPPGTVAAASLPASSAASAGPSA